VSSNILNIIIIIIIKNEKGLPLPWKRGQVQIKYPWQATLSAVTGGLTTMFSISKYNFLLSEENKLFCFD